MPANVRPGDGAFSTRGTAGGYRDPWSEDDTPEIRSQMDEAERRALLRALALGGALLREESGERPRSISRLGIGRPRVPFKEADARHAEEQETPR